MNLHKFYLQLSTESIDIMEKKFDFVPDLSNVAAAKSLDNICRLKTQEISCLRNLDANTSASEKSLREYRDYATKLL